MTEPTELLAAHNTITSGPSYDHNPLLTFSTDEVAVSVEVAPNARIHVSGNWCWVWDETDASRRGMAGSISTPGSPTPEFFADVLRRCVPENDPRWAGAIPAPFFDI